MWFLPVMIYFKHIFLQSKIYSMSVEHAYNSWAEQYDTNINKTRDLEATSLREMIAGIAFDDCLEIGCGTGKNTVTLLSKAKHITAVDLSEEMLNKAKQKINSTHVDFIQADITKEWSFVKQQFDLVTFSLVLEHIEDLNSIFKKVTESLKRGGYVYVGELHPFKQYMGSKARFETEEGVHIVACYNHHLSDFVSAAKNNGLAIIELDEYFDEDNKELPRILTLLLRKK